MNAHQKEILLLVVAGTLAATSGCVIRDEPVRPAPTMSFVATDDEPIVTPSTVSHDVSLARPPAPDSRSEERTSNDRLSRLTISANDLRSRFDNLAATVALVPEVVDFSGRERLERIRTILSEIDGALLRLKMARTESATAIDQEVERSLADGNRQLVELSEEIARRRIDARK